MNDLELIASTVDDNLEAMHIIANDLVAGSYTDENDIIAAYNAAMDASVNAQTCYNHITSSVSSIGNMVAASTDTDVIGNLITACQELQVTADLVVNAMEGEFGIVAEDDDTKGEEQAKEVDVSDEEDGEELDNEEEQVTAGELRQAATENQVTASEAGLPLFDFIN